MKNHSSRIAALWAGYLLFIIYGSLVPLDIRPLPLEKAWALFQQTPMLRLGIDSRADWIANGVLYVPIGFLTAWLFGSPALSKRSDVVMTFRTVPLMLAGLFCISLAFSVEFSQLFFPPRTVSLNDLLAETIGSSVGLIAASMSPKWVGNFLCAHHLDTRKFFWHVVEVFLVAYVAFSLFPYDVLVSISELMQKIRGSSWGWWLAGESALGIQGYFKLVAEVVLTLPFGAYLGYRLAGDHKQSIQPLAIRHLAPASESIRAPLNSGSRQNTPPSLNLPHTSHIALAATLGALLGIVLELAQFFTATGVSQGASILTRLTGTSAGFIVWQKRTAFTPDHLALTIRRYALLLSASYLGVLFLANGWFSYRWRGTEFAASQLTELKFLPFYYHYYTTEARALLSLASVVLMYLPIGIMTWANRGSPTGSLGKAAFLALIVESGKLFLQGTHPDPTNIILAGATAWLTVVVTTRLTEAMDHGERPAEIQISKGNEQAENRIPSILSILSMGVVLVFCAYQAATFPAFPIALTIILTASATIVWKCPARAFILIPLALPVLDLAPWSGRFYFDEFDLLLQTCLAVGYARVPSPRRSSMRDPALTICLSLLAASLLISTAIALWPWQAPGENSFTNYFSPYNALRIGKGALWAFLCIGLMRRLHASGHDTIRPWAQGMTAGLALTVTVIIWERATFASLFDFASDYRVTGPISAMHTGGAYIECFLAVATPFLLLLILRTRSWANRLIGIGLLLATTYALMVTYSRGGYAAFAVGISLFLFLAVTGPRRRGLLAGALALLAICAAYPVLTGQFAQQRLANIKQDLGIRTAHWRDVLDLRTPGLMTSLFGMGLGRFPETRYLLAGESERTGSYTLRTENGNAFLRLTSGRPLYFEQIVPVDMGQRYRLTMNVRSSDAGTIGLSLCAKWLLTSFECQWRNFSIQATGRTWSRVELSVDSPHFQPSPWYARKPVKLSLQTPVGGSRHVDVDNIRLEASIDENLLQNGAFESGMDNWFISAEDHLAWHTKSLIAGVLFDLGWFGFSVLGLFATLVAVRSISGVRHGGFAEMAILSALTSVLTIGVFDTLIDAPRFVFLAVLLGALGERFADSTSDRL